MAKKKRKKKINKGGRLKRKLFYLFLALTGISLLAASMLVLLVYLGAFGKLPGEVDIKDIKQDNASLVFASDGSLMGKYYLVNRQSISNESISPYVRHALIATEDNRFFEHHGIDLISLGRVFFKSLLLGDDQQGGGSTISQQLAKNLYNRKKYGFISLPVNKIREMFIASELENIYSKEEILTMYLNTVSFGENVYGIEAAAWRFYGKPSAELNVSESATLIGMLAANTRYNPRINPDYALQRRNTVLSRMKTQGFIDHEQTEKLKAGPIKLNYRIMDMNRGVAPYFRHYIRKQLKDILDDSISLERDGLRIFTTIHPEIQSFAEAAIDRHMKTLQDEFDQHWKGRDLWEGSPEVLGQAIRDSRPYQRMAGEGMPHGEIIKAMSVKQKTNILTAGGETVIDISPLDSLKHYLRMLHTGFLAVDPRNGAILAWVGGTDFQYLPYDHVMARRQAGSTFKPFVYATALLQGMDPCSYISNEQRIYPEYDNWNPGNTGGNYEGYYSLAGGLSNSVNTITAEIMIRTGARDVVHLARDMGISAELPQVPSLALGTADVSLLEMITAYTGFANYGTSVKPFSIIRVEDSEGNTLYEAIDTMLMPPAFPEETGMMMNYMLQGVIDHGTAKSTRTIYGLEFPLAGKTGTTQHNADGWFIGYTPGIVAGAWVGAENPSVHFRTTALGSGAHMALPIVAQTLHKVKTDPELKNKYLRPFRPMADTLFAMLNCPPYSPDIPTEYLSREEVREFRREAREKDKPEPGDTITEKKTGFFKKIRNFFKGNK